MTAPIPVPRQCEKREAWVCPDRDGLPPLIIGTTILIALGGGTHPLTLGLLSVALGVTMAIRPPAYGIGGLAGLCWIALLTWILLALWLPAASVDWRLAADFLGIQIGSAISPQPWVSIEALIGFLAGSAFLFVALANRPNPSQRRHALHLLAGALTALGVGAIVAGCFGWRLPWADEVHVFSWFPNRNQTALTFACGSILSFGLAALPWYRHGLVLPPAKRASGSPPVRVYTAALWPLLGGCILLYAVFQSLSKGALIAWCCGMLTLLILRATSTNRAASRLLRFAPALAILLFSFFVFLGGASRDRMVDFITLPLSSVGDSAAIPADFRWHIYVDTVSMIADQPWTGVGLGQFQYIFPQYRAIPAASVAMRHPESDWLWWTAELGVVGLALIIIGLGALLFRLRRPKASNPKDLTAPNEGIDQFYHQIALAALVAFFVHSLVDVGAHRLGTVSLVIILYALALPQQPRPTKLRQFARPLGRASGVVLLLAGIGLMSLSALQSPLLTTYAPAAKAPLATAPLQWQPYFRKAVQTYPNDPQAALDTFYQARLLKPENVDIALQEGLFLLRMNNDGGAFAAFSSAILRSHNPVEPFLQILRRTASKPVYHNRLRSLAQNDEALIAAYWCAIPTEILNTEEVMADLTKEWHLLPAWAQQSILEKLSKRNFNGRALSLFEFSQADKQQQIWPAAMQVLVAEERWEEALALFDQRVERKPLPAASISDDALRQLQAVTLIHSHDPVVAARLINAYLSRRMWDEVRRTADQARTLPGYPPDTLYWLGLALSETNRQEEAAHAYADWLLQRRN
jgi:O-antigen ligase